MLVHAHATSMRWLLEVLLAMQLFATAVLSGNDHANQLWTLVGCDDVDVDGILDAVDDLATAAKEALAGLAGDPVPKSGKPWSNIKQAMLLWGIDYDDVDEDMAQVPENEFGLLQEIYGRYHDMMEAVKNPGVTWDRDSTFFFCKAFQSPYPFVKAKTLGEYYNGIPPDEAEQPMSITGLQVAYYPPAGFMTNPPNPADEGRRRISFRDFVDVANFDGNPCYTGTAEAAVWTDAGDQSLKFLALCSSFYSWPTKYDEADPDENTDNLDYWVRNQAALLLHELMHLRFPEVIDVVAQLSDMRDPQKFYGYKNCCGLSGIYPGGSRDLAKNNADNYRLFAAAVYFDTRPWEKSL